MLFMNAEIDPLFLKTSATFAQINMKNQQASLDFVVHSVFKAVLPHKLVTLRLVYNELWFEVTEYLWSLLFYYHVRESISW